MINLETRPLGVNIDPLIQKTEEIIQVTGH